jgi:K+-sensing histidine kinase KdpD
VKRIQIPGFANPAVQFLVGAAILAVATGAFFQFRFHLASVVLAYLVVIVLVALFGSVIPALALIVAATGLLAYYFAANFFLLHRSTRRWSRSPFSSPRRCSRWHSLGE